MPQSYNHPVNRWSILFVHQPLLGFLWSYFFFPADPLSPRCGYRPWESGQQCNSNSFVGQCICWASKSSQFFFTLVLHPLFLVWLERLAGFFRLVDVIPIISSIFHPLIFVSAVLHRAGCHLWFQTKLFGHSYATLWTWSLRQRFRVTEGSVMRILCSWHRNFSTTPVTTRMTTTTWPCPGHNSIGWEAAQGIFIYKCDYFLCLVKRGRLIFHFWHRHQTADFWEKQRPARKFSTTLRPFKWKAIHVIEGLTKSSRTGANCTERLSILDPFWGSRTLIWSRSRVVALDAMS